jgi:hypothetical protein
VSGHKRVVMVDEVADVDGPSGERSRHSLPRV